MTNRMVYPFRKLKQLGTAFKYYWSMIKSLQTFLLLITGIAGYISAKTPIFNLNIVLSLSGSLFLAISGSTILNMWFDRDIDAEMNRTCWRPLPSKQITPNKALATGILFSISGVVWAISINKLFGFIVFGGLFFDVIIYTIWLKRTSVWSIIWGGISGGMPILAGRALGLGHVDWVGILLALAILFWIPTHMMTFSLRYQKDYEKAGIPIFPTKFGATTTQRIIALSSVLSITSMASASVGLGLANGFIWLFNILSIGLLGLSLGCLIYPSDKLNFSLFKFASIYMLGSMLIFSSLILK